MLFVESVLPHPKGINLNLLASLGRRAEIGEQCQSGLALCL